MSTKLIDFDIQIKEETGAKLICGVDEAGRGPLAGPVCACAIIMREDNIIDEINDSKKLSEKKRGLLYDVILENALAVNTVMIDERAIDEINILNATMLAMKTAIDGLSVTPELAIIDGNCNRGIENSRCIVKGDALSYNIAAASIIAKETRDRYMREIAKEYPEYGFEVHKGYGTKAHREALLSYGPCKIHRMSFLTKILGG